MPRHQVLIEETGACFGVDDGESVLAAALRADIPFPHECTFGNCGSCRFRLCQGEVAYDEPPPALSDEEARAGYALGCQAHPRSDLRISIAAGAADFPPSRVCEARIVEIGAWNPDTTRLVLQADGDLPYVPGQHLGILLPDGRTRNFSMAAPPSDGRIELQIRRIPGGAFTGQGLAALRPGDVLRIEAPLGTFCYHFRDYRPLLMAATGTGLAPVKAIVESLLDDGDTPPIHLYWGQRAESDLYLLDTIAGWASRLDDFTFVPVLSRPGPDWTGRSGYVQHAIAADFDDLSEHACYLCGSPAMILDAKRTLLELGASAAHLYTDSFTFQPDALAAA
ncbi:2Fe-2S iron-sulfur cluster-binding protein [Pigmentiphaga sp.]|uniref:2Fe-2S iron-sulfur cluster-binding protein n=1 Tax=Pigmentiphaga sp. TaxID=1977564 RepID=UPI00128E4847|nr:2Fe-2S iron-sulfur cluster-binding protein [Pigmentiphaga sp.]MPS27242.1 2Fe-2S iron-sulfur cluster binding domain-containing protein [Alcaligenaceae bacterium SAGV5]MPS51614.1 2Fe-2S iron-sulfur cluster binding domain-containing protein [Alcaligenaceae bacterium SAGV3]MPT55520.1 2Fe-2S iron-sulfur cluster binding domain-containing protein [Alcaligenaceae bacterium]